MNETLQITEERFEPEIDRYLVPMYNGKHYFTVEEIDYCDKIIPLKGQQAFILNNKCNRVRRILVGDGKASIKELYINSSWITRKIYPIKEFFNKLFNL